MILSKDRRSLSVNRIDGHMLPSPPFSFQSGLSTSPCFSEIFPCAYPTSPAYTDYNERLKTFKKWTKGHIMKPEKLADAGLFFLDDRDRCKCFYCNGGLQNWEQGDDPMEEHAKYFPQCEYVLARLGPDYVATLNARFPNLTRPTIPASPPRSTPQSHQVLQPVQNVAAARQPSTHVQSQTSQIQADDIKDDCLTQQLASDAEQFGFDKRTVMDIISKKRQLTGSCHRNLTELIDDLIQHERGDIFEEEPMDISFSHKNNIPSRPAVVEGTRSDVATSSKSVESDSTLRDQLQKSINDTLCKSCFKNGRDCVFLDCGHLCCCHDCGKAMNRCPICNLKVREVIKIFKM